MNMVGKFVSLLSATQGKSARLSCLLLLAMACGDGASAATLSRVVSYNFTNGAYPRAGLVRDAAGNFYGTTSSGGNDNACNRGPCGAVFKLTPPAAGQAAWLYKKIAIFHRSNGGNPQAGLVIDAAGNLYGTTTYGGKGTSYCGYTRCGTVFQLVPPSAGQTSWTLNTLVNFNNANGAYPTAGLALDALGSLYGTTLVGGSSGACAAGCGTVFQLSPSSEPSAWTFKTLASFDKANGARPSAGLVVDALGNLYGTTTSGGNSSACNDGCGTVFQLAPPSVGKTDWTLNTLFSFDKANGANPEAGLVLDAQGNLYGTTLLGGSSSGACALWGCGTVFRLSPPSVGQADWTLESLAIFNNTNGALPKAHLVFDKTGNLYGTTFSGGVHANGCINGSLNRCGTVFELMPPAMGQTQWTLKTLAAFKQTNGAYPQAGLAFDPDGNLYGTAIYGGAHGYGVIFKVTP